MTHPTVAGTLGLWLMILALACIRLVSFLGKMWRRKLALPARGIKGCRRFAKACADVLVSSWMYFGPHADIQKIDRQ